MGLAAKQYERAEHQRTAYLKMAEMANVMSCVFYHNL